MNLAEVEAKNKFYTFYLKHRKKIHVYNFDIYFACI